LKAQILSCICLPMISRTLPHLLASLIASLSSVTIFAGPIIAPIKQPRLIVTLVIDQFRSDYLTLPKFKNRFGKMGFQYLLDRGAYFPFAEYEIYQSLTGPGHATILTGSYPYVNGIVANDWYQQDSNKKEYCVSDPSSPIIGSHSSEKGFSPKNLLTSTLGDELKTLSSKNKVVAIALKDRSAILLGGHKADLALWFDPKSFKWVTSKYYANKLPSWVDSLNEALASEKGADRTWSRPKDPSPENLVLKNSIGNVLEKELGSHFPHRYTLGTKNSLTTPYGTTMTLNAAKEAISSMTLGQDEETDILAVSFSNHDYLGHIYGHQSDELEEMMIEEDKAIAELLGYLKEKIPGGLDSVWITLTGDHGVSPVPELAMAEKLPASRLNDTGIRDRLERELRVKFGKPRKSTQSWIAEVEALQFYLNVEAIKDRGVNVAIMESYLAEKLEEEPGILRAFTSQQILSNQTPDNLLRKQIANTYFNGRSGNVLGVVKPFQISNYSGTTHMTGYTYDRMVPLLFVGKPFRAGLYATSAKVVDLAPTLAFGLGITPPAACEGRVLNEILQERE